MNNRTVGIIATVLTSLICGCAAIIACAWGAIGISGQPITVTEGGQQYLETMPPAMGAALLCLSLLFIAVPVAVGFFTLRKKPEAPASNEPLPPAS